MHLITGAIIAALLGNKSNEKKAESPILNIHGPINTTHVLPGRVRFHIPTLKKNAVQGTQTREQLLKIDGVQTVDINELTGSVLIYFNHMKIKADLLATALIRLLRLEKELEKTLQPTFSREIREMGESLNRAVYEKTGGLIDLWTAIPLLLIAVAGKKIITDKTLTAPAAATLLWWGYNSLFHEKQRCD